MIRTPGLSVLIRGLNNDSTRMSWAANRLGSRSYTCWLEGKSIDLPGCYFLKLARIPNEDLHISKHILGYGAPRQYRSFSEAKKCAQASLTFVFCS
jgi:hypothetical protein